MSLQKFQTPIIDVNFPQCQCPVGPVLDYQLREFKNGSLHVYRFCRCCGTRATSLVPRTSIPLSKWRELLIANGYPVKHTRHISEVLADVFEEASHAR